jgi:hypothetical protein
LLEDLRKRQVSEVILDEVATAESVADAVVEPKRAPMNRAERRAQVAMYARILAAQERQTPIVNPTIIPKAKRRRHKGGRNA